MVARYVAGVIVFLEIHQGKEGMESILYHLELGTTSACTKRFMEEMKVMGQRALKWSIWDCFLFYSWFSSKKLAESATYIGVDLIYMVKTNTKGFSRLP